MNQTQPDVRFTDTPRHKLFTTVAYALTSNWSAMLNTDTESRRYSSSDGARVAGGFTLVDARVRGRLRAGFDLSVGIRNAFDRRYEYQEGFPEPGRTYFAELGKSF